MLAVLVQGHDLHRDMPHRRILLELIQHRPAQHVGQEDVQRNGGRMELAGQYQRLGPAARHQGAKALSVGLLQQHPRIGGIVFHDEQNRIARLQTVAVVGDRVRGALRQPHGREGRRAQGSDVELAGGDARAGPRGRRADIGLGQVEGEGAAQPGHAAQLDLTAQQAGQLAADRQAEAGAAVLAAGAGVGLLECLEDDPLFFLRDADAGVRHLERHDAGSALEDRMVGAPAGCRRRHREAHPALLGELEGVGEEVLEHLLEPLRVGDDGTAQIGIDLDIEGQLAVLRLMPERPGHRVEQAVDHDLLRHDRDGAGLDFGEVENVGDEVEQVGAGPVDGAGKLNLPRRQVALRILAELLAQDQDRVERGPELVGHIGQELRLVLRRQGQLGRLLLERPTRLLDLLVLALDFHVLLGELLRLLRELLVGLLELLLLGLQLGRELLRLLEQALGLHGGLDAVEHDADRGGELFQERQVRRGEGGERRQLDDRLDLVLEQHR